MFEQARRLDFIVIALLALIAARLCWKADAHPTVDMHYQISVVLPRLPGASHSSPLPKQKVDGQGEQNKLSGEMKPPDDDDEDDSGDEGPPYDDAVYGI